MPCITGCVPLLQIVAGQTLSAPRKSLHCPRKFWRASRAPAVVVHYSVRMYADPIEDCSARTLAYVCSRTVRLPVHEAPSISDKRACRCRGRDDSDISKPLTKFPQHGGPFGTAVRYREGSRKLPVLHQNWVRKLLTECCIHLHCIMLSLYIAHHSLSPSSC